VTRDGRLASALILGGTALLLIVLVALAELRERRRHGVRYVEDLRKLEARAQERDRWLRDLRRQRGML